jgi:hypothetical protein
MVEVLLRLLDPASPADALISPSLPLRRAAPLVGVPILTRVMAAADGLARAVLGPLLPADPPSALKAADHRRVGIERRCATSERISLAEVPKSICEHTSIEQST